MKNDGKKAFYDFLGVREFEGKKYVEYEKYQEVLKECEDKEYEIDELKEKIYKMNLHNRLELPTEPIKVAEMLIYATERRENCMTGEEYDKPVFEKWKLEQIARHLLVYCNNSEDE